MSYSRRRLHSRNRREYERKFEEYRDVQPAVVFSRNGTIHVPGMPGYIWVHQLGHTASPMAVFKGRAPAFEGLWVWIGRSPKPPFRYQILDVYTAELAPSDLAAVTRAQLPLHKQNHEWPSDTEPGIDALPIWQPALQMLKCTGNGDLTVTVNGLTWGDGNRFLGNNAFDLSAYVPATGQLPVLVYFDTATEALGSVEGTYTTEGNIWQAETVRFPDAPPQAIPSAFVMLSAGQTAITEEHVFDARSFLDVLGREEHPLRLDTPTTLTIDELAAIQATTDSHYLEAESGTEDNLETILGAEARQFLLLRAAAGHTITIKHNDGGEEAEGNIFLNGEVDFVLTDEKSLLLFYHAPYWTDVGIGVLAIDDLTDVTITTPVDNEVLAYDNASSEWINQTPAEAGLAEAVHTHTEADITDLDHDAVKLQGRDISAMAPTDGQVLAWDDTGSEWSPADPGGGSGVQDRIEEGDSSVEVIDAGTGIVEVTIDSTLLASFNPGFMLLAGAMRLSVVVTASSGATHAIDMAVGNIHEVTLSANCTFSMSNPPATGISGSFLLVLHPAGFTPTFPGSWKWTGDSTVDETTATTTIISGFTIDGGTTYYVTLISTGIA